MAFKKSAEVLTSQVLPDSPFFPIPRLIDAAVRGEDPDLTPPRPPGFADDGDDRCYVKD